MSPLGPQQTINAELICGSDKHLPAGYSRNRKLRRLSGIVALEALIRTVQLASEIGGVVGVQHGRTLRDGEVRVVVDGPHDPVAVAVGRNAYGHAGEMKGRGALRNRYGRNC